MTSIHAIFFDLGKTLIYPREAWHAVFLRANKAVTTSLIAQGIDVDQRTFPHTFAERINRYYVDREETLRELTTMRVFKQLLEEKGYRDIPAPVLRVALNAWYAITQSNWQLESDAHKTLRALKLGGCQLALLSNAADDSDVQTLVDKNEIRAYFSFIRTSAASGYRKPHRQLFEEAMHNLGLFPQQCMMVGDTLDADILGANKLGIYSVWNNRRVNKETKTLQDIRPKASIKTLSELPQLVESLRK